MPAASHRSIIAFWLVLGLASRAFAQDLCLIPEPEIDSTSHAGAVNDSDDAAPDADTLEIVTTRIDVGSESSEATFGRSRDPLPGEGTITAQSATLSRAATSTCSAA